MDWLIIPQVILSLLLIGIVLIQPPSSSIGSSFGGSSANFHTKKGSERFIFSLTFILAICFVIISLLNLIF
jgi:protein translocase SecG subunit